MKDRFGVVVFFFNHTEVDCFPVTACPEKVYSTYTTAKCQVYLFKNFKLLVNSAGWFLFIAAGNDLLLPSLFFRDESAARHDETFRLVQVQTLDSF